MLKNLSIRTRLILAFGAAFGFIVVVGAMGLTSLRSLGVREKQMYENVVMAMQQVGNYERAHDNSRVRISDISLQADSSGLGVKRQEVLLNRATMDSAIHAYQGTYLDAEDSINFQKLIELHTLYNLKQDTICDLIAQNRIAEARTFRIGSLRPVTKQMGSQLAKVVAKNADYAHHTVEMDTESVHRTMLLVGLILLLACGCLVGVGYVLTRSIRLPLDKTGRILSDVANRDLTARVRLDGSDELGVMARSLDSALDRITDVLKGIRTTSEELGSAAKEMSQASTGMDGSAARTSERASTASASADSMSGSMQSISAASEQSSTNIAMVASAVEELSSTVTEISRTTESTRATMASTLRGIEGAVERMERLDAAGREIGTVVQVIAEVADQTKLLALNATIEAARAGEAGKGFAVVAGEVKELARSTSQATDEIRQKVETMQAMARDAVQGIRDIKEAIDRAAGEVVSIAGAVEEQAIATRDIAGNVGQAAAGVQEVNRCVLGSTQDSRSIATMLESVKQDNHSIVAAATQVRSTATRLDGMAQGLREAIQQFKLD